MKSDGQPGFTLIETLLALAILSLVMLGALTLFKTNQDAYRRGQDATEVHQNARVALETMSREVRIAGYDTSGELANLSQPTALQAAGAGDLTFVADVDDDGVLDRVRYRLAGTRLLRESSSWVSGAFSTPAVSELADGITTLGFAYFDDQQPTNAAFAVPVASGSLADVRRITITLVAAATSIGDTTVYPLVVDVRLRN